MEIRDGCNGYYKRRDQIAMLPTPTAQDAKNATLPPSQMERDTVPGALLRAMLPTPKKQNANSPGIHGDGGQDFQTEVASIGLQLQPAFVEWMMGYPENWTEVND